MNSANQARDLSDEHEHNRASGSTYHGVKPRAQTTLVFAILARRRARSSNWIPGHRRESVTGTRASPHRHRAARARTARLHPRLHLDRTITGKRERAASST